MGSNNNKNQQQQTGYGPNAGQSSSGDPRGRMQNQSQYQQQRYESQQGPMADAMGYNYGRSTEADYGNYTDLMNQYRDIASNGGGGGSSGGGGGGGGAASNYSAFTVNPERVGTERATTRGLGPLERVQAKDPFESYKGMQEFSNTGGYSAEDTANMRARGVAPIRAAYANAERAVGQQRGLQGGYSPNAIAAQVKMAREQGQGMADASQNVEGQLAEMKQRGRLSGLQGMSGIESDRLGAQMQGDIFNAGQANEGQKFDISNEMNNSQFNAGQGNQMGQFNADMGLKGQMYNADAYTQAQARNNASAEAAASRSSQSAADNTRNRLAALAGGANLYGTTPGASNMFGNQLLNATSQGGTFGLNLMEQERLGQQLPGQYDQTMGRIREGVNMGAQIGYPIYDALSNRGQNQNPDPYQRPTYQQPSSRSTYGGQSSGVQTPYNPYPSGGGINLGTYNPNQYVNQNTINPNSWQAPNEEDWY